MAKESGLGMVQSINRELDKALSKIDRLTANLAGGSMGSGGNNILAGALGSMSKFSILGAGVSAMGGAVGGVMNMMPNVQATVARAGGYYGAGVAAGGMNRRMLENVTFSGLKGGITSAGSDAAVASYLVGQGMNPNSKTYGQTLSAVGNAAKYLNMGNENAAAAIAGLTSGSMSAQMMNTYGIFTSNPMTGQSMTQGQIFEQMAQRFTSGQQKASVGETMESLRRGALGSNIRNSGLSADQQAMFSQFMIERAKGNYMDLSDQKQMDALMAKAGAGGNENPFSSAYRINTAQTGAMGKAEENYLKAIEHATPAIELMNKAAGEMATSFLGYAKAYAEVLGGDPATAGAASGIGSILGGIGSIATTALAAKALGGGSTKNLLGSAGKMALKGAGVAGGVIGLGASGVDAYSKGASGTEMTGMDFAGSALSGAMLGATLGSIIPGAGTVAGGLIGAAGGLAVAGISNFFGQSNAGGPASTIGMGSTTDTGGTSLARPVAGGTISASYGQKGSIWSKGYHSGTDYAVPVGTPVYAAAAGTVSAAQAGSGSHSYGIYIKIDHDGGYSTLYGHLSQTIAKPGDVVAKGQLIAKSGDTGHVTGAHLHFEVFKNGVSVDPSALLSGVSAGTGNEGKDDPKSNGDSGKSLMDVVLGSNGSALAPPVNLSWSGVRGNYISVSQQVASSMSSGTDSIYSPVVSASGAAAGVSAAGGAASNVGLGATSNVAGRSPRTGLKEVVLPSIDGGGVQVNIEVNVAQASEAEARKLAELVKSYLEDDSLVGNISRR